MALEVNRIRRIAVAVLDIEAAVERYKKLFDIDPFDWGEETDLKYKWVAFRFGKDGANRQAEKKSGFRKTGIVSNNPVFIVITMES